MTDFFKIRNEGPTAASYAQAAGEVIPSLGGLSKLFNRGNYKDALNHYIRAVDLSGKRGNAFMLSKSARQFGGVDTKELSKQINALVKKGKLDSKYKTQK